LDKPAGVLPNVIETDILSKGIETESDGTIVNSDKPAGVLPNVMRTEGDGTKATALYHDVCAVSPLKDF
jgi:hypothetical protein